MSSGRSSGSPGGLIRSVSRSICFVLLASQVFPATSLAALPRRLILALDGIAYRDLRALQEGVTYIDSKGRQFHRQGFHRGYFPVSRLVSTFPSASDVAWTDIFGNRPLPGYQRTYFSHAANDTIGFNSLSSSMDYERQMTWRVEGGFRHAISYVFPRRAFRYAVQQLAVDFLHPTSESDNYYAFILATDDAQHLDCDIFSMLCALDDKLQEIRVRYKAREGRDLEILILSDHGNNHAGAGQRIEIRSFLKRAGYRIWKSILRPKDVVLPTAGIESWVELHNCPAETERLVELLSHLEGVDIVTAQSPHHPHRFIVMSSSGQRAGLECNAAQDAFRYWVETGDPLQYHPVLAALSKKKQLDSEGFAPAAAWMAETMTHRYPVALERIVRGHTRVTLNPATILISLKLDHVHASWLIKKGSEFVKFGGTHGALDDLNSTGVLLSSFAPTPDTCSSRVAGLFGGFPGRREYRAEESGAEWVSDIARAMTTLDRAPLDWDRRRLPREEVFLRIWTPSFTHLGIHAPVEVTVDRTPHFLAARIRRGDPPPSEAPEQHWTLNLPVSVPHSRAYERVYALPPDLILEPHQGYRASGRIRNQEEDIRIFTFGFRTDSRGRPVAY
jgi:hypothetical protein